MSETSKRSSLRTTGQLTEQHETEEDISKKVYPNLPLNDIQHTNENIIPPTYSMRHCMNPNYEQHCHHGNKKQMPCYLPRLSEQFVSSYRINYADDNLYHMDLKSHQSVQNRFPLHKPHVNVAYPYYHHNAYSSRPYVGCEYCSHQRQSSDLSLPEVNETYQNLNYPTEFLCPCYEHNKAYFPIPSPQNTLSINNEEPIDFDCYQFPHMENTSQGEIGKRKFLPNKINCQRGTIRNEASASYVVIPNDSSREQDDQALTAHMFKKFMESIDSKIKELEQKHETFSLSDSIISEDNLHSDDRVCRKEKSRFANKTPVKNYELHKDFCRNSGKNFQDSQEHKTVSQESKYRTIHKVKSDKTNQPLPYPVIKQPYKTETVASSLPNMSTKLSGERQLSSRVDEEEMNYGISSRIYLEKQTRNTIQDGCRPKIARTRDQMFQRYREDIQIAPCNSHKEFTKELYISEALEGSLQDSLALQTYNTTPKTFCSVVLDEIEKEARKRIKHMEPLFDSSVTSLRNIVEKVIVRKCKGKQSKEWTKGIGLISNFLNLPDVPNQAIPNTDDPLQEHESTLPEAQMNESLSYKDFIKTTTRIPHVIEQFDNFDETEETEDCRNDEVINVKLDGITVNATREAFPSFIPKDEDSSSDESFHSVEEYQAVDNEYIEDFTTSQITLEKTNNSKYSTGISENTIRFLGKNLSDSQCRLLVRDLGLTQRNVEDTENEQGLSASREEIRERWISKCSEKFGSVVNNTALIKALFSVGRADLVTRLFPDFVKDNPQILREIVFIGKIKLSDQEYKDVLGKMQSCLKTDYGNFFLPTTPWLEHKILRFDELYVDLKMFPKNNSGIENTGKEITLQEIFLKVYEQYPYRILVEGPPGYGKTTFTFKLALDWAKNEPYLKRFNLVFIIALRHFHGDLEEVMLNECKIQNVPDYVKLSVIKRYESNILLILDGFDELSDDHKTSIISLLRGEIYSTMTVLLTSRTGLFKIPVKDEKDDQYTGGYVEMTNKKGKRLCFWRKRIEIKGISPEKRKLFLQKYLQIDVNNLYRKLAHVMSDEMKNLYECPLVLLLFAMLVEDKGVENISSKTDLYKQVVNFIVRRSLEKQSLIPHEKEVDLFSQSGKEFYVELIMKLGEYSLQKLTKQTLMFNEEEILEHCNKDETVLKLGFLTKNVKHSKHEESEFYEPVHKTFLEFLAAFRLWFLCRESEDGQKQFEFKITSLIKEKILDQKDSLLFIFLSGLLEEQTKVLLKTLNPWSYKMSAYEYPISDIVQESQCMAKLLPYIIPFIPWIFQHQYDFLTNAYNWHVLKTGIDHRQIKLLHINAHHLTDIPNIDYVEIVQLDIWGKDLGNKLSLKRTLSITCKDLICWFYGFSESNWNYYAHVVRNINSQQVSLVVNAYDDYSELQLILGRINEELRHGQWKDLNIRFLKVLGLDGKNDRDSLLPLIGNIVNSKMIKEGLIVVVKSVVGSLNTLSFWFKTTFLKSFKEIIYKFDQNLRLTVNFKEHLKGNFEEIISEINTGINDISTLFESTVQKLESTINFAAPDQKYDRVYERGNKLNVPLKKLTMEIKINWFVSEIKRNGNEFLKDLEVFLTSTECETSYLHDSFKVEIHDKFNGFCKLLELAEARIINTSSDDFDFSDYTQINKFKKYATCIVQDLNPFKFEMETFLSIVSDSNLLHFTLNNGYCNSLHPPRLNPDKYFRSKEWEVLQLGNKVIVDDNVFNTVADYKIKELAFNDGREKYTEQDVATIYKCNNLQSLSLTTILLKKLQSTKNEEWKGLSTLKKLFWILDKENIREDELQLLEDFKNLEHLSISFGSIPKKVSFQQFPYLPLQSLKTLEITEIDHENTDFIKDLLRNLLNEGTSQRLEESDDENIEVRLLELKLNISRVFNDKDVEEIYDITKRLLLTNTMGRLSLINPNESHDPLIMRVFSFTKALKISKTIEEFHNKTLLFCQPEKSCSSDIRNQVTICKVKT